MPANWGECDCVGRRIEAAVVKERERIAVFILAMPDIAPRFGGDDGRAAFDPRIVHMARQAVGRRHRGRRGAHLMQAKDISDGAVLEFLAQHQGR